MVSNMVVNFFPSQVLMDRTISASCRMFARAFLAALVFCFWPQAAWAEHRCGAVMSSDEYVTYEVYNQFGGLVDAWCEWEEKGDRSEAEMRYYSPDEWKAFGKSGAKTDDKDAKERALTEQRYLQILYGLWFMPGEVPFAGWLTGSKSASNRESASKPVDKDCTASFWKPTGAVILSARQGPNGVALISYMGSSIPAPSKPESRKFSLTQSGKTQTVNATISKVGLGGKQMGMVTFGVPSGSILVGAIEDVQDYSLADEGKTIFSGQWHDGLKVRDALAQCLAQQR